jgi:DNA-damage-inducible protein J
MAKDAVVRARIESELKTDAELILRELGVTPTEVVTMLYRQITLRRGLPFEVRIPNDVTLQTFRSTDAGENSIRSQDKQELNSQGQRSANAFGT